MRLTVRITWSASPERRLPRLAPPSVSSPTPVPWRRSSSAQSGGAEHVMSVAVSFSTQRKAGMFSFEPRRMPAWLAPVCDERSGSHSTKRWLSSASQRAMFGALPSRIARWRTGSASPSISRKTRPGTSVSTRSPERRAMRSITRSVYVSSSFVPNTTSSTTVTAAAMSAVSSAHQKLSTFTPRSLRSEAARSMSASRTRTSRKPRTSVNGSRIAATSGGIRALRIAMISAVTSAPKNVLTSTCGTRAAATTSDAAATSHETKSRSGLIFGRTRRCSGGIAANTDVHTPRFAFPGRVFTRVTPRRAPVTPRR